MPPLAPNRLQPATLLSLLLLLTLLQLLPSLDLVDFHREEARRVLPAREMLASGNFILPTIWQEPYLSKPPGYFWILAAVFEFAGGISEYAARLTSVVATFLTAASIAWVATRLFSRRAGLLGGALYILAYETLNKGRLAEIEPTLALFVFLSVAFWWFGTKGPWWYPILSGFALAGALLCKGPAAVLFFVGPPVAMAIAQRAPRYIVSARFLVPAMLGLGLASLWPLALFQEIGYQQTLDHWGSEISGQGGKTLAKYTTERIHYLAGTLFAFAPASFIVLLALRTPAWRELRSRPEMKFAVWAAASGWLFFLFFPGTNVRYAYPGLPFIALLAGRLLEAGLELGREAHYARRLSRFATAIAGLAIVLALTALVGHFIPLGEIHIDTLGLVLAAVTALAAVLLLRNPSASKRLLIATLLLPLLFGQLIRSQDGPARAKRHSRKPLAAELDATLPDGAPLYVGFWTNFNTLLYVEHEVRYERHWEELEGEAWLLIDREQFDRLEAGEIVVPWPYVELYRRPFWAGERVLLHLAPAS